jgi:tetratricopeptide (TPR) repeat protein
MSFRRLVGPLVLLAACGPQATHPAAHTQAPIAPAGPVKAITNEDDYGTARQEYDALAVGDAERAPRRAALATWLLKQVRDGVEGGHPEDAYDAFKQAATLWDPSELQAGKLSDPALLDGARRIEQAFRKRGAHEEVLAALVVEMALDPADAGARGRYDEIARWLRAGGATESEMGAPVDGRSRVIDDLETVARLWPSPFVVAQLTALYLERHDAGSASDPLAGGRRPRRGSDLRALLAGGPRPTTGYDLARLYLRISRPDEAVAQLQKLKAPQPGDEQIRLLVERYASKQALPSDALNVAMLLAQGHDDADVAERVCSDAAGRFPKAPEPHLCAGEIAMAREQLVVAMRELEAARQLQPADRKIWEQLARLWQQRLFALVSNQDQAFDVTELETQLKKVEAFHGAAQKQFPGEPLHPSLAGALFEVGRGYYNVGRLHKAMEYLERSVGVEPSATALEQMGQIRLKQGEAKEAIALFERAVALPKSERSEEILWRAHLRHDLGDAFEALGDAASAETARKGAIADWDALTNIGLTADGKVEAAIERAKLYYQLGDRDEALSQFELAIDAAPDRAGTYADVIAFLVPRGELDEALDAYHRALGRNEVTEYLKVYCSLWIVDLARRAKQPVDPLASSYLASMDGGKWYDDLARWATGRESDETLLSHANTPAKKAESSYYRAMRAVEVGNDDEAKRLWKEVVDTDMMAFFEYDMAQMFLKLGTAPAHPVLKSSGKPKTAPLPKPPEGSI